MHLTAFEDTLLLKYPEFPNTVPLAVIFPKNPEDAMIGPEKNPEVPKSPPPIWTLPLK